MKLIFLITKTRFSIIFFACLWFLNSAFVSKGTPGGSMGSCNLVTQLLSLTTCNYRPQTKFAKVMFLQVSVCPHGGGVHGCSRGGGCVWLLPGGFVWLLWGACVVARGACVVAVGACVVALGGVRGCSWEGCMVAPGGGMRGCSWGGWRWGLAWLLQGGRVWDTTRYGDTVNERAVRILLECILV